MSKKKKQKKRVKNQKSPAKKSCLSGEAMYENADEPLVEGGSGETAGFPKKGLTSRCPNEHCGRIEENDFHIQRLCTIIMDHMKQICRDRKIHLNYKYWKSITYDVLSVQDTSRPLVIPARAGSGKSTWIQAFLNAAAKLWEKEDTLVDVLGGILLVVQKVEDLNRITQTLRHDCKRPDIMIPVQAWHSSSVQHGWCINEDSLEHGRCMEKSCPHQEDCPRKRSAQDGCGAYILGITQARYLDLLRPQNAADLAGYLERKTEDVLVPRRFILIDEKIELLHIAASAINTNVLANALLELDTQRNRRPDLRRRIDSLEYRFSYCVQHHFYRIFQHVYNHPDNKHGACTLKHGPCDEMDTLVEDTRNGIRRFLQDCRNLPLSLMPNLGLCLDVAEALVEGRCFFDINGGKVLFCRKPLPRLPEEAKTILFDATAEVDPDYPGLWHGHLLDSSPPLHMEKLYFHVYTDRRLKVSMQALHKQAALQGFAAFLSELIEGLPGKTFLCTYKEDSEALLRLLSEKARKKVPVHPGKPDCVPYYGGNNGSNSFNDCSNVILLGYPRLDPQTYFRYSAILAEETGRNKAHPLSKLEEDYEARHLAARLEQELYRCAIRNPSCDNDIHVFLFTPPERVSEILRHRFLGCHWEGCEEYPEVIRQISGQMRTYKNKPTHFARLSDWLAHWEGGEIYVSDLKKLLEVPDNSWKELMKQGRTKELLQASGVIIQGSGRYRKVIRQRKTKAA